MKWDMLMQAGAVLSSLGLQVELAHYLYDSLRLVPNVRVYGPAPSKTVNRAALCSFNVEDVHPTDIATFLDQQVQMRHCPNCSHTLVVSKTIL